MNASGGTGGLWGPAPGESTPRREAGDSGAVTVSQITRRLGGLLSDLGPLVVEGELGPPKRATSGHVYFDLKDERASLSCVVWRSAVQRAVPAHLEAGMRVRAHGSLDVYAPRGSYSLVVRRLVPVGEGELLARFERLKAELAERGWFDRRRALPRFPRTIGVVTSRDGAALRDVLRTRTLRWPGYPLRLRHSPVQGPGSEVEVARAIAELAESGVDLVLVTRGGGSLEDLWTFNTEQVARAIWECPVPVVSAVGHETDTTLADFVADARAHTPTDGASLVVPDRVAIVDALRRARAHLERAIGARIERVITRLERVASSAAMARPARLLELRRARLARLGLALERPLATRLAAAGDDLVRAEQTLRRLAPSRRIEQREERLGQLARRSGSAVAEAVAGAERSVAVAAARLEALSPLVVLARGYAVATGPDGRALRSAEGLAPGDALDVRLHRGRIRSRVERVHTDDETVDTSPNEPDRDPDGRS